MARRLNEIGREEEPSHAGQTGCETYFLVVIRPILYFGVQTVECLKLAILLRIHFNGRAYSKHHRIGRTVVQERPVRPIGFFP